MDIKVKAPELHFSTVVMVSVCVFDDSISVRFILSEHTNM